MKFDQAQAAMRDGRRVARRGWNGKGMFAYYVPGGVYPAQVEAIKGEFPNDMVPYKPYYALKTAQECVSVWVPSIGDIDADDWYVIQSLGELSCLKNKDVK
ncbi:DUF2829 domain-containing protein [Enterovibrio sp. 27052020O]|uniref:DUF2829 domain-containing protein n=1 Tax=Enterovibrio sp. 27052020O TaxID=3241166 RepID=UPI0038903ED1